MIIYLDPSALVNLILNEEGRDLTIAAGATAMGPCTSAVAYVEARSAVARKLRENSLGDVMHERIVRALDQRWPALLRREVTIALAFEAGAFAQAYGLRGYDAVHLASALDFQRRFDEIGFLGFDDRPNDAAVEAGLTRYSVEPRAAS